MPRAGAVRAGCPRSIPQKISHTIFPYFSISYQNLLALSFTSADTLLTKSLFPARLMKKSAVPSLFVRVLL